MLTKEIVVIIILLASTTLLVFESLFSQLLDNNNVFAQSELIANTFGNYVPRTDIFNLTSGYTIEPVVWNLTLPSSVTFDNENNMYIAEAGFVYGGLQPIPRILKVDNQN